MAMEVSHKKSKKLHHHATPVLIVAIALLVGTASFVLQQNTVSGDGSELVQSLFTRTLHVTRTSNGFARVTLNNDQSKHVSPEISQAGRTAELLLSFDQKPK